LEFGRQRGKLAVEETESEPWTCSFNKKSQRLGFVFEDVLPQLEMEKAFIR